MPRSKKKKTLENTQKHIKLSPSLSPVYLHVASIQNSFPVIARRTLKTLLVIISTLCENMKEKENPIIKQ